MVGDTTDETDVLIDHDFLYDFCAWMMIATSETALDVLVGDMLTYQLFFTMLTGLHFYLLKELPPLFLTFLAIRGCAPPAIYPFMAAN